MISMKRVLLVVAHPDDDVLGCGGLLAKYKNNSNIIFKVLFLGEGSSCRYNKKELNTTNVRETIEERNSYAIEALNLLSVNEYTFNNYNCGRFDQIDLIDIGKTIEKEINLFKPDTIFTHSEFDVNNDHQLTYQAVLQATRPGAKNFVKNILSFEILSSSEWRFSDSFQPNLFIELSNKELKLKIEALNKYLSETKDFPFPRSDKGLEVLSNYRGMQIAKNNVEAFKLIRGMIE